VEATGDPEAIGTAVAACADGGRIILLGSSRGAAAELPVWAMRRKRLELVGAHISALPGESRRAGADWLRELGDGFLSALAEQRVRVDDLAGDRLDPREAERFYGRLAADPTVRGGWFDWSLVPSAERCAPNAVRRLPNLRAGGMTESNPLPVPLEARAEQAPVTHASARRERPLRFALLGCGDIGFANAHAIAGSEGAQLVACYDAVPELARALAGSLGARAAGSEDEVFEAGDVDAVFIAAPHHLHEPLASRAARSGLHVIVEKPLAHCLASAREIVEVTRDHGVALSVCFPFRYEEHVVAARQLIEAGVLGVPRGALITYAADKPQSYWVGGYSGRAASDWRSRRSESGGGVLIMNLCHYFDLVRHLTGLQVDAVSATTDGRDDGGVEQSVGISIRYEDGAVGSVFGSSSVRGSAPSELRIWGTDGHVVLEPEPRLYTLRALGGAQPGRWHALPEPGATNVRIRFVERFAAAVREQRPPDVSGEDGLAVQAAIEAAYDSARTGAAIRPSDLLAEPAA
jgi:predicted dehydrogenase